jgi:hypothetical protein
MPCGGAFVAAGSLAVASPPSWCSPWRLVGMWFCAKPVAPSAPAEGAATKPRPTIRASLDPALSPAYLLPTLSGAHLSGRPIGGRRLSRQLSPRRGRALRGNRVFGVLLCAVMPASLLWAGGSWNAKPYTQWTLAELRQILENSPWAHSEEIFTRIVRVEKVPGSGTDTSSTKVRRIKGDLMNFPGNYPEDAGLDVGARARSTIYFQWFSALTLRQALARNMQLAGARNRQAAQQLLDWEPAEYVISVSGSAMPMFDEAGEESLRRQSSLEIRPSGRILLPAKVVLLREGLLLAEVRFYFPRVAEGRPSIDPAEKKAKLTCKLPAETLDTEFNLRKMNRNGQPDL